MSLLNNGTLANPTTPYYALATESAKNWYNFPSQTGAVLLVDASGVETLQSVDGNLYYNNELLAKSGDIQDIADWSLYPALATVELAGQNITQVGDISGSTAHIGAITATSVTASTISATGITGGTVTASGLVSAGSVSATGNVQGASLTTTGGLDMTNTAITRASAVNLSAAGAAPYGALSSPDGVMLTWNGAEVKTGAAGNVAQWANYPAVTNVSMAGYNINNAGTINAGTGNITTGNIGTMTMMGNLIQGSATATTTIAAGANQNTILAAPSGGVTINSYNAIDNNAGVAFNVNVDRGINPAANAGIKLEAKNGAGGRIDIIADKAEITPSPGLINVEAHGGTVTIDGTDYSVGGLINITADSGEITPFTLTSAIKMSAAGINSYAGAVPPVGSLAGYNFIYGTNGVNICSGLPSVIPSIPTSTYIYGLGGVNIESSVGIQMYSDTYISNLYPLSGYDLILQGRSLPTGYVKIKDCNEFTMTSGGAAQINTITGVGGGSNAVTIDNIKANNISADSSNLTITGKVNLLSADYLVNISKADTIAFDAAGAGAITGLQTINGAPYVAPDTNQWALYPAVQNVDISGFGLTNVSTINGSAYPPPVGDAALWATFPAVQNVDISGYSINQVASLNILDNGNIVSAGALGIFSDLSGDLSLAAAGGGNVNIGNGGLGNINIVAVDQTTTVSGKIVNITGVEGTTLTDPSGIILATPIVNVSNGNIINVTDIDGVTGTPLTLNSSSDIALEAANDAYVEAQAGSANLNGQIDVNLTATAGAVNVTGATGIQLNSATTVGTSGANKNLTVNGTVDATGDVVSGFGGSSPYSLNTVGSLVKTPQAYNYWVATSGSNTTGTGSVTNPWATITYALAATASIPDGNPISICCTAGTYTESFTISRNNTFLVGAVGISNVVVIGTISLIPGATAQTTISQGITGISVVGNVVCSETTATEVNWYLDNINVTSYGVSAVGATGNATGNTAVNFNSCIITQNTTASAAVQLNSCRGNLTLVQVIQNTTSPALSLFTGNSSVACNGTTLQCAGSATAGPVVFVNNTLATGSTNSFYNTTFQYVASTAGAGKTGVSFANAVNLPQTTFNQCVWLVGGSTTIITDTGIGNVAVLWGQNVCSPVSAIPAPNAGLVYTYMTQDFIRANTLRDQTNSAGAANQVLTAGTGAGLQWTSLTIQGLGGWVATPAATAYQNSLVMYNATAGGVSYDTNAYTCVLQTAPATVALATTMRGRTYIVTSAGNQTLTITTATLTANDTGFFVNLRNGNAAGAGDVTIAGATGNTTLHAKTGSTNGGTVTLYWNGTALIAY